MPATNSATTPLVVNYGRKSSEARSAASNHVHPALGQPLRLSARRLGRSCVIALASLASFGCHAKRSTTVAARPVSFDSLVEDIRTVALQTNPAHPLGSITAGRVLSGTVILLDATNADVKVFDLQDGTLRRIVGEPGDGPGELRHPVAVAVVDSQDFAILDQRRRRVSIRALDGSLVREMAIKPGSYSGLLVLPEEHRIVISGLESAPDNSTAGTNVHEYDYDGRALVSYGNIAKPSSKWAQSFGASFLARQGNVLVEGLMNGNRLRTLSRTGEGERWVTVADGWFRPLAWPPDVGFKERGQQSAIDAGLQWMHKQRLMNGVFAIGDSRLLVRFQAWSPSAEPFFYYAVIDTTGKTLQISNATRAQVFDTHGDTLYWTRGTTSPTGVGIGALRSERSLTTVASH